MQGTKLLLNTVIFNCIVGNKFNLVKAMWPARIENDTALYTQQHLRRLDQFNKYQ